MENSFMDNHGRAVRRAPPHARNELLIPPWPFVLAAPCLAPDRVMVCLSLAAPPREGVPYQT
jgi:hypothetical protein